MKTQNLYQFGMAATSFTANPNAESLLLLNKAALSLVEGDRDFSSRWNSVDDSDAFISDFSEIRVVADKHLDTEEVRRLSGCLGYALRQSLAGEDLSEPSVSYLSGYPEGRTKMTVLEFFYDSTKSRRDDPDYVETFDLAREYAFCGSPVRLSNRAGIGTKGTRLIEGIHECDLSISVR